MRGFGLSVILSALGGLLIGLTGCGDDDGSGDVDSGTMMMPDDAGPMMGDDAGDPGETDAGPYECAYPPGPYGTSLAKPLEPFELEQCDGTPYHFVNDGFCDASLTVISIAAGWCPPCIRESMELTERVTEAYRDQGVRVIQILTQDQDYNAPTHEYCQAWVDRFGLTNVELIDPYQITQIYFPDNSLPSTIIVDDEGIIRFRENGASEGLVSLTAELDELLAEESP